MDFRTHFSNKKTNFLIIPVKDKKWVLVFNSRTKGKRLHLDVYFSQRLYILGCSLRRHYDWASEHYGFCATGQLYTYPIQDNPDAALVSSGINL